MRICVPIDQDLGRESPVSMHFGAAPYFAIADSTTGEVTSLVNRDDHDGHGQCRPVDALADHNVDAIVVGGIGMGAIRRFHEAGIRVYQAMGGTVADALAALEAGTLPLVDPSTACAGHGHG
ncbi:MAG: NifB/NifX family molybdenum-iron cluster-binding protein [Deltaproteobacteria bacterium]|nr:NifB/NifX family molybdenum-iron cluster-binding protein [Deltaproteobacteria bacterium]